MISHQLGTGYDLELRLNPFLAPGMRLSISSAKANVAASEGAIYGVRHEYRAGRARTYLQKVYAVAV
jgi:hypothetical protein